MPNIPTPLISLIFITHNSARVLPECLATLASTHYHPYEVIVVDNASSDATPAIARAHADVHFTGNATNLGFGRACHQGAAVAHGDLLVFLNPDLSFTPEWLSNLVQAMHADPAVAICAPIALYPGSKSQSPEASSTGILAPIETASVSGAALMIRRSAWDILGGFDQQIFLYWEDTDLCWRAWLAGMRVLYIPNALIYHERGGSGGGQAWSSEAAKNGLYVHLKLMRWRRVIPYLLRQIPASCLRALRGQGGAFAIWWWNILNLRKTLAQRRIYLRQPHIDPAYLERLITIHDRTLRKRRWYTGQ